MPVTAGTATLLRHFEHPEEEDSMPETIADPEAVQAIGRNAGTVWNCLNTHSILTIAQIRPLTGLSESDVQQAVGWLAREGKVVIDRQKGRFRVGLTGQ